jgi:general stress protein 26
MTFEEVQREAERLGPLASFCTVGFDGSPHVVPLIPVWVEAALVFGARTESLKVRHLRRIPLAAVQFLTPGETFPDALLLKGTAEVIDDDSGKCSLWDTGRFPFLVQMYDGPTDPRLSFVSFQPDRASLIRDGARGATSSWRREETTGAHPTG